MCCIKMQKNVLEYLENTAMLFPDRIAYQTQTESLTFKDVLIQSKKIGTFIAQKVCYGKPIIVIGDKNLQTIVTFISVIYAGCYYVPLDTDLPDARLKIILDLVEPALIITNNENYEVIKEKYIKNSVICFYEVQRTEINEDELLLRRDKQLDLDPIYIIFTSGSTGTPKGVVISHRATIYCIDVFAKMFNVSADDVFGNQAPLNYISAVRDIYLPLKCGAKTVLIPKTLFSTPVKLFEYINENKITTICWVASVLSLCAELNVFNEIISYTVKKVFFSGSVLPCKHLRIWQKVFINAMFINHYGPTETTSSCNYYNVDHLVNEDEILPIGKVFENAEVFLLNENNYEVPKGEIGEICVRSPGLALGYLKDKEKTDSSFIINPLNTLYPELIYKTGDLGSIGSDGLMYFHGRCDSQIKHMGYRIELGEIEYTAASMKEVNRCCCFYQENKEMIWLFFTGNTESKELSLYLRTLLSGYMIPRKFVKLDDMPVLSNGKIDMGVLKKMMEENK